MLSAASLLALTLTIAPVPQPTPAGPEPEVDRPFRHLLSNLGHDIRKLPSADTAFILGVGLGGTVVLHPLDDNLADWVSTQDASSYTKIGDVAGNGWVQVGAAVATYAAGVASDNRKARHIGSDLIRGHFLTGIVTQGLKVAVGRERPNGGGRSFPSGHTSAAFLSASVLQSHLGWKAGAPAYALGGFIAWTRVRDNAHWLTDAIVGATVGMIVGRTVTSGHGDAAWVVAPSASAGQFAIYVVRR